MECNQLRRRKGRKSGSARVSMDTRRSDGKIKRKWKSSKKTFPQHPRNTKNIAKRNIEIKTKLKRKARTKTGRKTRKRVVIKAISITRKSIKPPHSIHNTIHYHITS